MFMNLSEAFTSKGVPFEEQFLPELADVRIRGNAYRVVQWESFTVKASCVEEGRAKLGMSGALTVELPCDRCLQPTDVKIMIDFEQDVYAPEAIPETMDADEQEFLQGYQLDVQALIHHEVVMNWPLKILCREDCRGLCAKCGKDLNEGECGCDAFVPDVRMAAIKDIFLANKEV